METPDRLDALERENTHLRLIHARFGCPYGYATPEAGCSLGYPGCACMDDLMAMASWSPEDEDKAAVRIGKRLNAALAQLDMARGALQGAAEVLEQCGMAVAAKGARSVCAMTSKVAEL